MRSFHAFIGIVWMLGNVATASAQEETTLYTNAKIVTVDASFSMADSMIVKGSRINGSGKLPDYPNPIGSDVKRVDLQGKMVLPGLIDSHVHALGASTFEWDHPVPDMANHSRCFGLHRQACTNRPDGRVDLREPSFHHPTSRAKVSNPSRVGSGCTKPSVCFRTGPDAAFNSLGLAKNQIDKNYVAPQDLKVKVERDPSTQEPTGIIRNYAKITKVDTSSRSPSVEKKVLWLWKSSYGITMP